MDLPFQASERRKIIGTIDRRPWQTVTAVHAPGRATAQRTSTILQHDLRDGPEQIFANRIESRDSRDQQRRTPRAKEIGKPAFGGGESENAIGARAQSPRKPDPRGFIGVE